MAEVFNYREGLLNKLASSMGVSTDVAKAKAIQIADSYQSILRYVSDDKKAEDMLLQSPNVFGVKVNKNILDIALTYVRQFEGNIASGDYIKRERANTPIKLDKLVSNETSRRQYGDYSRRAVAQAAGSTTLYANPLGPLFDWAGRNLRRISPSRETFANIRAYANQHPRHTIYLSAGALAIAGLLSFGYMQGVKPNQIVSFYTGKAKPAVVLVEPQPKPLVGVAPSPAPEKAKAELDKPSEPKVVAPGPAPAAVTPAPGKVPSLEELTKEVNALKQQVTQYGDLSQQVQELRAKLEAFEKDYVTRLEYEKGIAELRELIQKAGIRAPVVAAPAKDDKVDVSVKVADHSKYKWRFNHAEEQHAKYIKGEVKYADLFDRVKAWFSLKHPKAELKQEGDKYSIAVTPITTYKRPDLGEFRFAVKVSGQWYFSLNPNEVAMLQLGKEQYGVLSPVRNPVGQLIMYKREGDILRIFASLNYERVHVKPLVEVPKPEPKVAEPVKPVEPPKPVVPILPPAPPVAAPPVTPTHPPVAPPALPPRVEPPKPTYGSPLEPEDLTEPKQKVPIPSLRLEPSRPSTRVPLLPEDITEPKILQVR